MKDRTTQLIVILFGALVVLTVYRGRFVTEIIPSTVALQPQGGLQLKSEFEVYGDGAIGGVHSHFESIDQCIPVHTLSVSLLANKRSPLASMQNDVPKSMRICPGEATTFSEIFSPGGDDADGLIALITWTDSSGTVTNAEINIIKKTSFILSNNEQSPDVLILLYPILWMAFGVLILAKLTKLIKD